MKRMISVLVLMAVPVLAQWTNPPGGPPVTPGPPVDAVAQVITSAYIVGSSGTGAVVKVGRQLAFTMPASSSATNGVNSVIASNGLNATFAGNVLGIGVDAGVFATGGQWNANVAHVGLTASGALQRTGGTMSGILDMGQNAITNVGVVGGFHSSGWGLDFETLQALSTNLVEQLNADLFDNRDSTFYLLKSGGVVSGLLELAVADAGAERSWPIVFREQAGQSNMLRSVGGRLRVQGIDGDFELLRDDAVFVEGSGNAITNVSSANGTITAQRGSISGGGGTTIAFFGRWEGSANGGWTDSFDGPSLDLLSTSTATSQVDYSAIVYAVSTTPLTNYLAVRFLPAVTAGYFPFRFSATQAGASLVFTAKNGTSATTSTQIISAASTLYTTNMPCPANTTHGEFEVVYSTTNALNQLQIGIGQ